MTANNGVLPEQDLPTVARYEPIALDDEPKVVALLETLGLGKLLPEEVTAHVGRNDNWSGPTTTGAHVFVKRLGGPSRDDSRQRVDRILAFETLSAEAGNGLLRGPAFLGSDRESLLVAFEHLKDARSGAELAADERFDEELCRRAGEIVAAVHDLPANAEVLDRTPHPLPPLQRFQALPLDKFVSITHGELEPWRLIQTDATLVQSLIDLRASEAAVTDLRPIHADMRLDQFLHSADRLCLTDWEEFRLGDPARDVGAFLGEWLYLAVHGIPKGLVTEPGYTFGHETSHEEILRIGARRVERYKPNMQAFWAGYRAARGTPADEGFRGRAGGYAGWHLIDRLLASGMFGSRIRAAERASAGIGRQILVSPESYLDVIGLGEVS